MFFEAFLKPRRDEEERSSVALAKVNRILKMLTFSQQTLLSRPD